MTLAYSLIVAALAICDTLGLIAIGIRSPSAFACAFLRKCSWRAWVASLLLGVLTSLFGGILIASLSSPQVNEQAAIDVNFWSLVALQIVAVMVSPILEEVLFKPVLFDSICKIGGSVLSFVVTIGLFSALHLFSTFSLLLAIATTTIYFRFRNLWLVWVIHIVGNATSFLWIEPASAFARNVSLSLTTIAVFIGITIVCVCCVVLLNPYHFFAESALPDRSVGA